MIRNATLLLALGFAMGDCRMCRKDPPPILFPGAEAGVEGTSSNGGEGADASAAPLAFDDGGVIARTAAHRVTGDGRTIIVNGVTVTAPERSAFVEYLTQDVDADGDEDLVATVTRSNANAGVLFYSRDEASFVAGTVSNADAPGRACVPAGLVAYTAKTWALRYERCAASDGDSGVDSVDPNTVMTEHVALSVDATGASAKLRVSELGPVIPRTRLGVDLVYLDRDGDGRADISVELGAWREGDSPDARARASVVLLDRGMGFARDTSEPAASIARLLSQTRTQASARRRATDALAMIERVQRLRRALCVEAGAPRLRIGGETGLRCASMFSGFSEVYARALLTLGELPAVEATQWPDSAPEFGVVESERFDQELQRATGSETGITARSGPFIGANLDDWPLRASVLSFDPPTAPTHVALRGAVHNRIELATFATATPEVGTQSELILQSPDGARVAVGAWQTCDGVFVGFCAASDLSCANAPFSSNAPPQGAVLARLSDLPSSEFGARCLRREASSEPIRRASDLRAIGWSNLGLVVAWRGRLMRATGDGSPFVVVGSGAVGTGFAAGSAASTDGRVVALQGADAVFVRDAAGRWKGWRPPTLSGRTRQLVDVTTSGDGQVIAARVGTQLWVIERVAVAPTATGPHA
ncbi:MAG: hypothetical protein U0269_06705 [Polyangiales bacterium]